METISGEEFIEILYSNKSDISISDYNIEYNQLFIDFERVRTKNPIFFQKIIFSGKHLNFYNKTENFTPVIQIEDCVFNTDINIEAQFDDISFRSNTFNCDKFQIINSKIGVLEFINNDEMTSGNKKNNIFNKGNFKIHNCDFSSIFWLKNVQFMENTTFDISSVKFLEACSIDLVSLNKIQFYSCDFFKEFRYNCNYNSSQFRECTFSGSTTFEGLLNINSSFLYFDHCSFSKLANFNNYWLHKLRLEDTKFLDNVSFQETYFDIITIVRTDFEKKVWFDDIQIKKIDECDRRTIRTIKQELQKAENRIDFNRFRAYELAAHYEELDWKWNSGFIDKSILFATKISTDFGNSWRKALRFTVIGGFVIYLFLYIIENRNVSIDILNWDNWARLFSGFFRFLLVTDFYNPLETDRVYLTNPFSWVLLIFGKIFIAFGIYEMIQSFRKFKA
jgi:hypothetical protein